MLCYYRLLLVSFASSKPECTPNSLSQSHIHDKACDRSKKEKLLTKLCFKPFQNIPKIQFSTLSSKRSAPATPSGAGLIKTDMEAGRFHTAVKPHCLISPDNHSPYTHMLLAADSQCETLKLQKKAVGCCGNSWKKSQQAFVVLPLSSWILCFPGTLMTWKWNN